MNILLYKDLSIIEKNLDLIFKKYSLSNEMLDPIFSCCINGSKMKYSKLKKYITHFSEDGHCKSFSLHLNINNIRYEFLLNSTSQEFILYFYDNGSIKGQQPFNDKKSFNQKITIKNKEYNVNILVQYFYLMFKNYIEEYSKYTKISNF